MAFRVMVVLIDLDEPSNTMARSWMIGEVPDRMRGEALCRLVASSGEAMLSTLMKASEKGGEKVKAYDDGSEFVFTGKQSDGPRPVFVGLADGSATRLPHLMKHSPYGFQWGYGGDGPSDLARSIVGFLTNDPNPDPRVYQKVKWKLIATQEGDLLVTSKQVLVIVDAMAE